MPLKNSPPASAPVPADDDALKSAGLVYVTDDKPGFTRVRQGDKFRYRDLKGHWLKDAEDIQRINKLAIPPAYTDVWICPKPNGHLQATGRDARGRKQYRYHAAWREQRDEGKFERLEAFGLALPRIRACVTRDMKPVKGQPLNRTQVLATLVRLLDTTYLRVGNDEYARENGSFGLTTLRNPHAGVRGSVVRLQFRGKSGVMQDAKLDDPKVAAVVRGCQQLPGQELFQYLDEDGNPHGLGSSDVNDYLAEISASATSKTSASHFTAKDFRTWHGTVRALELTRLACSGGGLEEADKSSGYSVKAVLAEVSGLLGNTPAVCRKSYIHPAVMSLGSELAGHAEMMSALWSKLDTGKKTRRLYAAEHRLLGFLKAQVRAPKKVAAGKATSQPVRAVHQPSRRTAQTGAAATA